VNAKKRVRQGLSSQEAVSIFIKAEARERGVKVRVVKRAAYGQKSNDVVMNLDGRTVSFEVKGIDGVGKSLPLFDKSVRRRNVPPEIETLAEAFAEVISVGGGRLSRLLDTEGYPRTFLGMLDFYRDKVDPTIGLAEDPNSTSSGKLPRDLASSDSRVTSVARKLVLNNLKSGGDSYFAVHDKRTDDVHVWYTGYGENVLDAPSFPPVKHVMIDTYGGSSRGATRVAVKIRI
jgi:hypothetical protein